MREYHRRLELLFTYGKPRGGDPFPYRSPKKPMEIDFNAFIDDSYQPPPPIFTLDDFLKKSNSNNETTNLNKSDYNHCTDIVLLSEEIVMEKPVQILHSNKDGLSKDFPKCKNILLDENVTLPEVADRKPLRQQILEDKAFLLERYAEEYNEKLESAIKEHSRIWPSIIRPTYVSKDGKRLPLEDVIYEDEISDDVESGKCFVEDYDRAPFESNDTTPVARRVANQSKTERPTYNDDGEDEIDLLNSPPLYFQGERAARSPSPFEFSDLQSVFPAELAVLECAAHGATKLSLKAHFIEKLPDISQLSNTLTYINLSFNDFMRFPTELFQISQLETLKMRNNPLHEIPREIKKLRKLRNLVLSFCCISSLPPSLFKLTKLETLDLSYNQLSFVPDDINKLRNLQVLNFEGNQIMSFPRTILQMNLRVLNVVNNFTSPLFWKTTAPPQPQQLLECCANFVVQTGQHFDVNNDDMKLNAYFKTVSICDFCGGAKFGQGIRVIKPAAELYGVKNLPILFNVCSQTCRKALRTSTDLSLYPDDVD